MHWHNVEELPLVSLADIRAVGSPQGERAVGGQQREGEGEQWVADRERARVSSGQPTGRG